MTQIIPSLPRVLDVSSMSEDAVQEYVDNLWNLNERLKTNLADLQERFTKLELKIQALEKVVKHG